jgi:hypothetical protein
MTVVKEISKYILQLVGEQELRLDGVGSEPASEYTFFLWKGNENHELGTGFFVHKIRRIRWAGHVAQLVEKRNAYRILVKRP